MKEQYIKLFSFLIGITLVVSGIVYTFTSTYKSDRKEREASESVIADEIGNVYKTFFEKEDAVTKFGDTYNEGVIEYVSYYSNMTTGYLDIIEQTNTYEEKIKEVEDVSSYLKEKCKKTYSSVDANEKCNAYYINLEKTINTFVKSVSYLNTKIDEYNSWTEKENESIGATVEYEKLDKYAPKYYKDYVDLNEDNTYLEKDS